MRFTFYLKMALYLTIPKMSSGCLHEATPESVAAQTDHFDKDFVRENVAHVYDVVTALTRPKI